MVKSVGDLFFSPLMPLDHEDEHYVEQYHPTGPSATNSITSS